MDYAALKSEITVDPVQVGYAGKGDEEIARLLTTTPRPVPREQIDGGLLASALVRSEYAALSAADKDYVRLICATATAIPLTTSFKAELGAVFGAATATRANLQNLTKRAGTRAEELGLAGVTTSDVARARLS